MDTNIIKISGRAEIPQGLELETDYGIVLKPVECRKAEKVPNDDGTYSNIYSLRMTNATEVTIGNGQSVVKSSGKGSQSQIQRAILLKIADKLGVDREEYYLKRMSNNIKALDAELIG